MPARKPATRATTIPQAAKSAGDATLIGIYTSPSAGAPMEQQGSVILVAGLGIVGDRYALGTGQWSDPRWHDQELTLFESEVAEAIGIQPYQARRNLVTRGLSLNGIVGVRFRIGEAIITGVRPCDPCRYIQQLNAHPGLTKALTGFDGGLRCHIETGGKISLHDPIQLLGLVEA